MHSYLLSSLLTPRLLCRILDPLADVAIAFMVRPIVNGIDLGKTFSDPLSPKPQHPRLLDDSGDVGKRISPALGSPPFLILKLVDADSQQAVSSAVAFLNFVSDVLAFGSL